MANPPSGRDRYGQKKQAEILRYLLKSGPKPRVELAAHLKITKAAVTVVTTEMLAAGLLAERGESARDSRRRGRRTVMLDINENYKLVFGAAIEEGDTLFLGLTNLRGQVLDRMRLPLEGKSYRGVLELIAGNFLGLMRNNCLTPDRVLGIGVALSRLGGERVEGAAFREKLAKLGRDLSYALTVPVVTGSTIAGALGAQRFFAAGCPENLLLLRCGRETEAAVLINGRYCPGATGRAGGFAAMQEEDGCLEALALPDCRDEGLSRKLAGDIRLCCRVLDPEAVYGFGSWFETEGALERVNAFLGAPLTVVPAAVTEGTVFLSGCALAVGRCFYLTEI